MSEKIIIHDDDSRQSLVSLNIDLDEIFTDSFKEYLKDRFIVALAGACGGSVGQEPSEYFTEIGAMASDAAKIMACNVIQRMLSENYDETLRGISEIIPDDGGSE